MNLEWDLNTQHSDYKSDALSNYTKWSDLMDFKSISLTTRSCYLNINELILYYNYKKYYRFEGTTKFR